MMKIKDTITFKQLRDKGVSSLDVKNNEIIQLNAKDGIKCIVDQKFLLGLLDANTQASGIDLSLINNLKENEIVKINTLGHDTKIVMTQEFYLTLLAKSEETENHLNRFVHNKDLMKANFANKSYNLFKTPEDTTSDHENKLLSSIVGSSLIGGVISNASAKSEPKIENEIIQHLKDIKEMIKKINNKE